MSQTLVFFLYIFITYFMSIANGLSIKMISINSPHLNIIPQHLSIREKHQYLANISIFRSYRYRSNNTMFKPDSFEAPLHEIFPNYFVTQFHISGGSTAHSPYVNIDTGSRETWIQCEGCDPCFKVNYKNFDYKHSSTYSILRTDDSLCNPSFNYNGVCGFAFNYNDRRRVSGFVGKDDFYFKNPRTQNMELYRGLAFGCTQKSVGIRWYEDTDPNSPFVLSGVLGLASEGSKRAFINQLDDHIEGRFSYCIPMYSDEKYAYSTMYFGDDAQIDGDAIRQVQSISMNTHNKYHLYLNGISVDGKRLAINPSVFEYDPILAHRGFFIDTGSTYTTLDRTAYDALVGAVVKYFYDKYKWKPIIMQHAGGLELCYKDNYPDDEWGYPSVVLHFARHGQSEDVDMVMDHQHMFSWDKGNNELCLMVLPSQVRGMSIFGAFQQGDFKFLYDIPNSLLHFVRENCQEEEE